VHFLQYFKCKVKDFFEGSGVQASNIEAPKIKAPKNKTQITNKHQIISTKKQNSNNKTCPAQTDKHQRFKHQTCTDE
jgi:hypothetical protein